LDKAQSVAALGTANDQPQIVGGMGSLYLNINYPAEARQKGIEGRLTLEFVVETDGTVSNIQVAKSLHPLCDSAAVKGLRSVEFVPAKYNGKVVPVRMELPIRFQLKAVSASMRTNDPDR
jgi:TonB family protein